MEKIQIRCFDGYTLSADIYRPAGQPKGAVMVAPATGIRKKFYASFAEHLAKHGWGVITYDNRGIGDSLQGPLKKSVASLQQWGELDMPAVLNTLKQTFPGGSYHLVGHSAGGQLLGLMPNALDVKSLFNVACSSGSLRNMARPFRQKAYFFLNIFIPLNNVVFGYSNTQWLGMGEPLPKLVGRQWGQWCSGQGYVKTAFGKTVHRHLYDRLNLPSCWVYASDDDIANEANVKDMISVYSNIPYEMVRLEPKTYGLRDIGHMKFFSKKNDFFWDLTLDWLAKHAI